MTASRTEGTIEPRSSNLLLVLGAVGSPIALGTALLLYFGWVRSQAQAVAFGADVSVFEMSPQDLVLRSIDILFFPIVLLLLIGLGLLRLDPWLRSRGAAAAAILRWAWLLVPIGLVLVLVARPIGNVLLPLLVMLAIGGVAYGGLLARRSRGDTSPSSGVGVILVGALLTATLFWQTERLAQVGGDALAEDLKQHVADRLPPVTLLSAERMQIDAFGVDEATLEGSGSAYRYRYDGLYLLQRSGDKYFLLTDGWESDSGRLLVLTDNESIRLEFGG
jgi:hypothetical protein